MRYRLYKFTLDIDIDIDGQNNISQTPSLFVAQRGTWGNFLETRRGVGKSGVLEHKSGNISETRNDRGKVTMGAYRTAATNERV